MRAGQFPQTTSFTVTACPERCTQSHNPHAWRERQSEDGRAVPSPLPKTKRKAGFAVVCFPDNPGLAGRCRLYLRRVTASALHKHRCAFDHLKQPVTDEHGKWPVLGIPELGVLGGGAGSPALSGPLVRPSCGVPKVSVPHTPEPSQETVTFCCRKVI